MQAAAWSAIASIGLARVQPGCAHTILSFETMFRISRAGARFPGSSSTRPRNSQRANRNGDGDEYSTVESLSGKKEGGLSALHVRAILLSPHTGVRTLRAIGLLLDLELLHHVPHQTHNSVGVLVRCASRDVGMGLVTLQVDGRVMMTLIRLQEPICMSRFRGMPRQHSQHRTAFLINDRQIWPVGGRCSNRRRQPKTKRWVLLFRYTHGRTR